MKVNGLLRFLVPDTIWRWDELTKKYDEYVAGEGQWAIIQDKLILAAQDFVKQVLPYDKIIVTPLKIKKATTTQSGLPSRGHLEEAEFYCTYIFEARFGDSLYTFNVKNIPASADTENVEVFFECLSNYLLSAYISSASNLARHQSGYALASYDLMRIADSFILGFQKTVMLEYLYHILNFDRYSVSTNVYGYTNLNRYNLQLLERAYEFSIELSSRKIENQEIYTGFIFHVSEEELRKNCVKSIKLSKPVAFGSFKHLKNTISASNGRNIFFNVTGKKITHLFITHANVPEIAMEPFTGGKSFVGKPLILSVQGVGRVLFLQGDKEHNRNIFQLINGKPIIKDYRFIENYLTKFLNDNLSSQTPLVHFVKWLLTLPIKKRGTTVIIGDLKKASLKTTLVSLVETSVHGSIIFEDNDYSKGLLDHITNPDGALIFNKKGQLLFMASILPFSQGSVVIGGGSRHQSTVNFTREHNCIGITVSEDGSITVFNRGKTEIKF